jgi:integrase/recombinase XerC
MRRCSLDTTTARCQDLAPVSLDHGSNFLVPGNADMEDLLNSFLSNKSPQTIEAYKKDLEDFRKFVDVPTINDASKLLLFRGLGPANTLVLKYKNHLIERKLSPATQNRRLSALRSLVEMAGTLGLVHWQLKVRRTKNEPYRDTAGPGLDTYRKMVKKTRGRQDIKGIRDNALLSLMYSLALRRSELISTDLSDLFIGNGNSPSTIAIIGKGKTQKTKLTIPEPTVNVLRMWVEKRGLEDGPLFYSLDKGGNFKGRLTGNGLYRIIRKLGKQVGVETRPHGIRHTAVTQCCKAAAAANLDLSDVLQFSRHASLATLQIYVDKERNLQGQLATLVAVGAE